MAQHAAPSLAPVLAPYLAQQSDKDALWWPKPLRQLVLARDQTCGAPRRAIAGAPTRRHAARRHFAHLCGSAQRDLGSLNIAQRESGASDSGGGIASRDFGGPLCGGAMAPSARHMALQLAPAPAHAPSPPPSPPSED